MREILRRVAAWLIRLGSGVGALLFVALFACLITQVVTRFVFDRPAAWTEELAAAAFIWVIFWGAAFATPLSEHVAIDLVEARFGHRVQRISEALGLFIIGACFIWSLPGIVDYVSFIGRERTPVTGVPFSWVYAVFIPFVLMIALRCFVAVIRPLRHHPAPPDVGAK